MDDVVFDGEKHVCCCNNKRGREGEDEVSNMRNKSGVLNQFISNFVSTTNHQGEEGEEVEKNSGGGATITTTTNGDDGGFEEHGCGAPGEDHVDENDQDHDLHDDRGEKKSGVLKQFISNLVSLPNDNNKLRVEGVKVSEGEEVHQVEEEIKIHGGGGGIITSLISNMLGGGGSSSIGERGEINGEKKSKDVTGVGGSDSGGGIIDNIVSHLPTPLSVPTVDEASILIHSIIHD